MAVQPTYRADGHTFKGTDSKRVRWEKILGNLQSNPGSLPKNNPAKTDTIRAIKVKILRAIHPPLNGGGGVGGPPSAGGGGGGTPTSVSQFIACSGISDSTQISAITQLYDDLVSNNLWDSLDAIYPFVGGTAQSHSCNFKNVNLYSITWHGGLTHDANGVTGNGTSGYGDTGFNPSVGVNVFSLNSSSMGVYSRTAAFSSGYFMGAASGINLSYIGEVHNGGLDKIDTHGISSSSGLSETETDFSQNIIVSRTSATAQTTYTKLATDDTSNAVSAVTNANFYLLAFNSNGTAGAFMPINLAFAFIGSGLSSGQVSALKTIINTYQTTLGRNV